MKLNYVAAAFAAASLAFAATAQAQQMPTPEQTYTDIQATFGFAPGYMKAYPKSAIAGAWAMSKGLSADPANKLDSKVKSLINLAVAAQIPCRYCIWLETDLAKKAGATEEEISEAVAQAAYVRHWSTVLNGLQVDFDTFKADFGGE